MMFLPKHKEGVVASKVSGVNVTYIVVQVFSTSAPDLRFPLGEYVRVMKVWGQFCEKVYMHGG